MQTRLAQLVSLASLAANHEMTPDFFSAVHTLPFVFRVPPDFRNVGFAERHEGWPDRFATMATSGELLDIEFRRRLALLQMLCDPTGPTSSSAAPLLRLATQASVRRRNHPWRFWAKLLTPLSLLSQGTPCWQRLRGEHRQLINNLLSNLNDGLNQAFKSAEVCAVLALKDTIKLTLGAGVRVTFIFESLYFSELG